MKNIARSILLSFILFTAAVGCTQRTYIMSFTDADRTGKTTSKRFPAPKPVDDSDKGPDRVEAPVGHNAPTNKINHRAQQQQPITPHAPSIDHQIDVIESPAAVYDHSFSGNETEHIKFSVYDPFSEGNDSFSVDLDAAAAGFTYPINGKFSSGYGRRGRGTHSGVDLVAPAKTPIYAAFDGTVRLAKPYSGYGNVIVLRHTNGLETVYAHNSKNLVAVGQSVRSGEQIAQCGRTGRATTDHLHFEVRIKGQTINPTLLIDPKEKCIQRGTLRVSRTSNGVSAKLTGGKEPEQVDQPILASTTTADHSLTPATHDPSVLSKTNSEVEASSSGTSSIAPSPNQSKGMRVGDKIYDTPQAKPEASAVKYHTIVGGDTLSGIAKKYSTTVSALCALNNMSKNDVIRTGKKLRIK